MRHKLNQKCFYLQKYQRMTVAFVFYVQSSCDATNRNRSEYVQTFDQNGQVNFYANTILFD